MRQTIRDRIGHVLCAMAVALFPAGTAAAQPQPDASLEEVLATIGADHVVADHVVVVDTSRSMGTGDRYGRVRGALAPFLQAMSPTDYLALITFDSIPTLQYAGPVGEQKDRALGLLPGSAQGLGTDIGSALHRALAELSRPGASAVQTLVFVTDGRHEPISSSAYPTTTGPAWDALAGQGKQLAGQRAINSYALALGDTTDAGLVRSVFAETSVVDLPSDQVGPYLGRVRDTTRLAKARSILAPEHERAVRVSLAVPTDSLDLNSGAVMAELTLTSEFDRVPVTVSHVDIEISGLDGGRIEGLPAEVRLAPRQGVPHDVTLTFPPIGGFGFGEREITRTLRVHARCAISSPWSATLDRDLGISLPAECAAGETSLPGRGTHGWRWLMLGLLGLGVVVLAATAWWLRVSRQAHLRGTLLVTPHGQSQLRAPLGGRRMRIGKGGKALRELPSPGTVRGRYVTRPGRRSGRDLALRLNYDGQHREIRPSGSAVIGGVEFTYQPPVSRRR